MPGGFCRVIRALFKFDNEVDNSVSEALVNQQIGPLEILFGKDNGKYPHGNSLLIKGTQAQAIVDPCLGVVAREQVPQADMILLSHVHEDHVAGTHLFPSVPCYAHEQDAVGMRSLDGLLNIYGFSGESKSDFEQTILNEFHYQSRADVSTFVDGQTFDLGGVVVTVLHTPGHTRGHSCFIIEWAESDDKFVYLGDIELTGFGPYYGDAWSNLEDFEASLEKLKTIDAKWWLTFHHKGLIEGRSEFLEKLEAFRSVIDRRENNLLEYISSPRSIDEIVAHRFVYRPGIEGQMYDQIERRSMSMHLDRLLKSGRVVLKNNQYCAV